MERVYVGPRDAERIRLPEIIAKSLELGCIDTSHLVRIFLRLRELCRSAVQNECPFESDTDQSHLMRWSKSLSGSCETSQKSDWRTDHVELRRSTSPLNSLSGSPERSRRERSYWLEPEVGNLMIRFHGGTNDPGSQKSANI